MPNPNPSTATAPATAAPGTQQPAATTPPAVTPPTTPAATPASGTPAAAPPAAAPASTAAAQAPAAQDPKTTPATPAEVKREDLKLEGLLIEPARIDAVLADGKAKGWSKEQVQEALNSEHGVINSYVEGEKAKLKQEQDAWYEAAKSDKEIGGDGFTVNVELGKRVIDRFGNDIVKKILVETGADVHPEIMRMFVRIGKAMGPDSLVMPGAGGSADQGRLADRLYPKTAAKPDAAA